MDPSAGRGAAVERRGDGPPGGAYPRSLSSSMLIERALLIT